MTSTKTRTPERYVIASDCDFTRLYFGVAFLTQQQYDERLQERRDRLPRSDDNDAAEEERVREAHEHTWKGILTYSARAIRNQLVRAFQEQCQFEHCEICFYCSPQGEHRYGKECMIACGTRDSGTGIWPRRFNQNYTYKWLYASAEEQRILFNFFDAQRGKPYDQGGSLRSFTNPRATHGRAWFCSELVLSALQLLPCANFHEHRAECVESDDIYRMVCASPLCNTLGTCLTPLQMQTAYGAPDGNGGAQTMQRLQNSWRQKMLGPAAAAAPSDANPKDKKK